jgi:hypothetical protein
LECNGNISELDEQRFKLFAEDVCPSTIPPASYFFCPFYSHSTSSLLTYSCLSQIFPHLSSTLTSRVLLFIPSYFDFLRIRELFQNEREPFYQANEYVLVYVILPYSPSLPFKHRYMQPIKIEAQCKSFAKKNMKWLLCTERCYFYNRYVTALINKTIYKHNI